MKATIAACALLLALTAGCEQGISKFDQIAYERARSHYGFKVVKILDSSTLLIDWGGKGDPASFVPIRLAGVDAPDAKGFLEAGGITAAAYLNKLCKGKHVVVYLDTDGWYRPLLPSGDRTMFRLKTLYKSMGFIPGYVWLAKGHTRDENGRMIETFVNRILLEQGLARVDRLYKYRRKNVLSEFLRFEAHARARRAGLWQ